MWIVRLALRRPYTFAVFAILLLLIGAFSILSMPTDIFPNIDIPVVSIVWTYTGLSADQMANRIISPIERSFTTTVSDIEHIESQSLNGIGVVKVFFQPHVNIGSAISEITAISQAQLRQLPTGTTPPLIIQYNASSVPVLQLGLSGEGLSEQQLGDIGTNLLRTRLATVEGASIPYPYGGKQRQVQVDLDLHAMQAHAISPSDVVTAINSQNLVTPSGTMKVGGYEYAIETNSAPSVVNELNNMPVKVVNGAVVYIRDVAHVRDGFPPQTNIVRVDGQRSALMSILKTGSASTLEIISGIREKLPAIQATLPPTLRISPLNDQSIFVKSAITGVVREAIIAACLTGIMILVFLGSWRSTVIIAVSIPLSILSSLICLAALGETINIMTLGGLALAVGILVDDATVEIENINRNLEEGKEIEQAILDGAAQIAVPAFVSTISICIVFVPMFFLSGVSRYLFVPLAEAVVFAMLASYLLSRTVVPTMAKYLLKEHSDQDAQKRKTSRNPFVAFQRGFEHTFEKIRGGYIRLLTFTVDHAMAFLIIFIVICIASVGLLAPWLGQDFFPSVDAGAFKIHVRAHTGTRIEETAALCDHIEDVIRQEIPKAELVNITDNIGLPYSGLNLSYSNSAPVGTADADISVQLSEDHHPTGPYVDHLRETFGRRFPGTTFYVLPVDIVTQILNFGLSSPVDIQIIGPNLTDNRTYAETLLNDVKFIPGTKDTRIQQPFDLPKFTVDVDRTRASEVGITQQNVASGILVALSGSFQTTPNFYLDPKNGVTYSIAVQAPQYKLNSLPDLQSLPITGSAANALQPAPTGANPTGAPGSQQSVQVLSNLADFKPGTELGTVSHYDIQPVLDIYANVEGADLGSVTRELEAAIARHAKEVPHGTQIVLRGQSETMTKSYKGLLYGLAFSILLVYFLIVINFQSWLDPFLIISALPAAIAGIAWFLFLTGTRLSVPALTGTIMCMGVATANSILIVTFAREQLVALVGDARKAALNSGFVRFRPVLMTALAMIIGMVPMALGLGDGGEQNAPLGRAVIGGLLLATFATLFFVPTFFSALHGRLERNARSKRPQASSNIVDEQFPNQA
jgi:multidrug efflux pump subunit AcrB